LVQIGISRAAAVAPNPDKPPLYLDMPWVIDGGEVRVVSAVIEKMDANDVMHDAMRYAKQPQRLRAFMLLHGVLDMTAPVQGARAFDKLLTDLGIEHTLIELDDSTHCGIDQTPAIKFVSEHLVFETSAD
jgi:hypothetical protein